MGRYVPPDLEGVVTGNQLHRRRPPVTVRFEMPYAVWCQSCKAPTLIGQGVRFNAEKRQTGMYHTTRIWTFRMRHADCGGAIVIRTDPRNTAYEVVSGARRHDTGGDDDRAHDHDHDHDDGDAAGRAVPLTDEERQSLRQDAFARLERTIKDRELTTIARRRVDQLAALSNRQWADPGRRNDQLRASFRAVRQQRERDYAETEALRDKLGLGMELLPASEADARRAALVDFGPLVDGDGGRDRAMARPLFPRVRPGEGRREDWARQSLVSEALRNSRTALDPFLVHGGFLDGLLLRPNKRKRDTTAGEESNGGNRLSDNDGDKPLPERSPPSELSSSSETLPPAETSFPSTTPPPSCQKDPCLASLVTYESD